MPRNVVALIPCHNEEDTIVGTVKSILEQDRPLDRIIVVNDRSTDSTAERAKELDVEVFDIFENQHMKAGALNQALDYVLPTLQDDDIVLVVDADSIIGPNFISVALEEFSNRSNLAGVSGSYRGKPGGGILGWYQRNEYARWKFDDRQAQGKTVILSGAASAFKVGPLRHVDAARGKELKGSRIYDSSSLTEDFELSMALKHLGYEIRKMLNVEVMTSYKDTWRGLYKQRLRWDRGISENLLTYGWTKHTRSVWFRRLIYALQCPLSFIVLFLFTYRIVAGSGYEFSWFWTIVAGVLCLEKAITVWSRGWQHALGAGILVPEIPYDMFLQTSFMKSVWDLSFNKEKKWR